PPGVRTELRQKNQITRCKNEGKIRRPKDCLALDQFENLILPAMKMSRRPEAGRSAIVKNGELPAAVGGANPDVRLLAPRCPRHNARRCCPINRDRARSNSVGRHACSFVRYLSFAQAGIDRREQAERRPVQPGPPPGTQPPQWNAYD